MALAGSKLWTLGVLVAAVAAAAALRPGISGAQVTSASPPGAGGAVASHGEPYLYQDPTATATANVTQIFANGQLVPQTYGGLESISLQQEVFVIRWGKGAVTMLPRQYVANITVNRRIESATLPATLPASR